MSALPSTSMEDCYTNCFSLAEVHGLSWSCLISSSSFPPDSLDNCPVLQGFQQAQNAEIISLWRRVPGALRTLNENGVPILQSTALNVGSAKELWIFWYGQNKPSLIVELLTKGLKEFETDSWSNGGLPYKVRTLFFNALLNNMEKLLVSRGYLRFGRWYCAPVEEPVTSRRELTPKYITAFGFEFFIIGDREVCIQMRMQRQPTLLGVSNKILRRKREQPVILAPWSLRGTLLPNQPLFNNNKTNNLNENINATGVNLKNFAGLYSESASESNLNSVIEEQMAQWASYTPFIGLSFSHVDASLPKMLLVDVDGVPMFYPTHLIAVVADELIDDDVNEENNCIVPISKNDHSEGDVVEIKPFTAVDLLEPISTTTFDSNFIGLRVARKFFEDAMLLPEKPNERWNFVECTNREVCHCRACNNIDAQFDGLPSVSPAMPPPSSLLHPSTPRSAPKLTEPPSVPPTSIESVQSVDLRQFRRNPRTRYVQPQFLWSANDHVTTQDIQKNPSVEEQVKHVQRHDPGGRALWTTSTSLQQEIVKSFADGSESTNYDVYSLLPGFRNEDEFELWDDSTGPPRSISPFTPMNCLTPLTPLTEEQEMVMEEARKNYRFYYDPAQGNFANEHKYHHCGDRGKPVGLETIDVESPIPDVEKPQSPVITDEQIVVKDESQYSDKDDDDCASEASVTTVWSSASSHSNDFVDDILEKTDEVEGTMNDDFVSFRAPDIVRFAQDSEDDDENEDDDNDETGDIGIHEATTFNFDNELIESDKMDEMAMEVNDNDGFDEAEYSNVQPGPGESAQNYSSPSSSSPGSVRSRSPMSSSSLSEYNGEQGAFDDEQPSPSQQINMAEIENDVSDECDYVHPAAGYNDDDDDYSDPANLMHATDEAGALDIVSQTSESPIPASIKSSSPESSDGEPEDEDHPINGVIYNNSGNREVVIGMTAIKSIPKLKKNTLYPSIATFAESVKPFGGIDVETTDYFGSGICRVDDDFEISPFPPTPTGSVENVETIIESCVVPENVQKAGPANYEHAIERVANPVIATSDVEMIDATKSKSHEIPISESAPLFKELMDVDQHSENEPSPQQLESGIESEAQTTGYGGTSGGSLSELTEPEESDGMDVDREPSDGIVDSNEAEDQDGSSSDDAAVRYSFTQFRKNRLNWRRYRKEQRKISHIVAEKVIPAAKTDVWTNKNIEKVLKHHVQYFQKATSNYKQIAPQLCPNVLSETVNAHDFIGNVFRGEIPVINGIRRILERRDHFHVVPLPPVPKYRKKVIQNVVPDKPKVNVSHIVVQRERELVVRQSMLNYSGMHDTPAVGNVSMAMNLKRHAMMQHVQQRAAFANAPPMFNQSPYQHGPASNMMMTSPGQPPSMMGRSGPMPGANMFNIHGANAGGSVQMNDPSYPGMPPGSHPDFGSPQMQMNMKPGSVYSAGGGGGGIGSVNNMGFPNSVTSNSAAIGFPGPGPEPGMSTMPVSTPQSMTTFGNGPAGIDTSDATSFSRSTVNKHFKGLAHVLAVLLKDSLFNLHYDTVFDSCPMCSCNESIRTVEYGTYLSISADIRAIDLVRSKSESVGNVFSGLFIKSTDENGEDLRCLCAFSAVRHRYLCAADTNLFADDVREAIGAPAQIESAQNDKFGWFDLLNESSWKVLDMLRWYLLGHDIVGPLKFAYSLGVTPEIISQSSETCSLISPTQAYVVSSIDQTELDYVASTAIDASMMTVNSGVFPPEDLRRNMRTKSADELRAVIHPWGVQMAKDTRPPNDADCAAVLFRIAELTETLGKAINPTVSTGVIEGPLTWKALHHKATGKYKTTSPFAINDPLEAEHAYAPEPIPQIIVGSERDLMTTSPASIWAWDRISLAPYSWPKNVLYVGVIPDHSIVTAKAQLFFEDLSNYYERHRLGRHMPLPPQGNELLKCDAILRVSANSVGDTLLEKIEAYVNAFSAGLAQYFKKHPAVYGKRCWYEAIYRAANAPGGSSAAPRDANINCYANLNTQKSQSPHMIAMNMTDGSLHQQSIDDTYPHRPSDDPLAPANINRGIEEYIVFDEGNKHLEHVIVIYVVNPFSYGIMGATKELAKLVASRFMRAFNQFLHHLDPADRTRYQIEMIDLSTMLNYAAYSSDPLSENIVGMNPASFADPPTSDRIMRQQAFTVFSQPRQMTMEALRLVIGKSVTRFGPISQATDLMDAMPSSQQPYYQVSSTPYIVAPRGSNFKFFKDKLIVKNADEKVLFCSYCLVRDRFLIATVTDERGELTDSVVLSISKPTKASNAGSNSSPTSHVGDALNRLWSYLQGIMALDTKGWRLVIGRFGKLGHGEFKAWNIILSKKNLTAYNVTLKGRDVKDVSGPIVGSLQAALNGGGSCRTCSNNPSGFADIPSILTACLVSTEAEPFLRLFTELTHERASKNAKLQPLDYTVTHTMVFPTSPNIQDTVDQGVVDDRDEDLFPGFDMLTEERDEEMDMVDMGDLFNENFDMKMAGTIPNQPIAVGYSVSLAPALDVPEWFFAMCPNMQGQTPVHLKSALHINMPHIQSDELSFNKPAMEDTHVLDSTASDDVLRYVLQTYNDLSWMSIDIVTGQRKSCLPVHFQTLIRLHNGLIETLF